MYVGSYAAIDTYDGLLPVWQQAIIWIRDFLIGGLEQISVHSK